MSKSRFDAAAKLKQKLCHIPMTHKVHCADWWIQGRCVYTGIQLACNQRC